MEICAKIENGKAYMEFSMEDPKEACVEKDHSLLLQIHDRDGREVFRSIYPLSEEEPAKAILLHPHLWNGPEDPYLYHIKAYFLNEDSEIYESTEQDLALYTFEEIAGKGWFLNGKPFVMHAVCLGEMETMVRDMPMESVRQTLKQLCKMGANTLCLQTGSALKEFEELCQEIGLLVLKQVQADIEMADYKKLFLTQAPFFSDTYYRYKAIWSREPFLHIGMDSIRKEENGTLSLTVYTNQKKVALYVEGVLFEFLTGEQEFRFEEIPVKKYPVVLTAEAGEHNTAVTIYEHSQNFHKKGES